MSSETSSDVHELLRWLQADPEVRRVARLAVRQAKPGEGEMGFDAETISAVIGAAAGMGSLVVAVHTWVEARRNRLSGPSVRLEVDGHTVTLDGSDTDSVEAVVRALTQRADQGGTSGLNQ
ncbi:hypothetical protein ACIGD1_25780 [Streptomyces sp. NPDC085612]|uniref:effector-associated constant component EACC1 n=1 Tax=Streptomyces sp. NPDC085612 TaxID=3365732 RepID=UPI0037D37D43